MSLASSSRATCVSRSLFYFFAEIRHYSQSTNFTIKRKTETMFSQSSSKCLARFMVLDESKEATLVIHLFGIVILGVQSCSDIWQTTFHFPSRLRAELTREIYPSISVLEKHEVHEIYKLASQSSVNVINAIWVADRFDCGLGRAAHHSKEFWQKRKEEKIMINRMIALFNKYISSEVWQHNASSSAIHFWVTSSGFRAISSPLKYKSQ